MKNLGALLAFLAGTFFVSALGARATLVSVEGWYQTLAKPPLTPSDWVFGPVWSALFAAMAVAAWLVWKKAGFKGAKWALGLYGLQLLFNFGWSLIFFGFQSPFGGLVQILLLWGLILATLLSFYKISKPAAGLFVPYLLWVSFAVYLNAGIVFLNPPL